MGTLRLSRCFSGGRAISDLFQQIYWSDHPEKHAVLVQHVCVNPDIYTKSVHIWTLNIVPKSRHCDLSDQVPIEYAGRIFNS